MLLCISLNKDCFFNTTNSLLLLNAAVCLGCPELCGFGLVLHLQQVKAAAKKESCPPPHPPSPKLRDVDYANCLLMHL